MKMTPQHYDALRSAMKVASKTRFDGQSIAAMRHAYSQRGLSEKRFRWDWFWATEINGAKACLFASDTLYAAGLNDDHIDTAIRKIAAELERGS